MLPIVLAFIREEITLIQLDWKEIDRFVFGSAWTDARITARAQVLCEEIGSRWATSQEERRAAEYIGGQFEEDGLEEAALELFELATWDYEKAEAVLVERDLHIDLLPFNRCPPCALQGQLVDAGYGTPDELADLGGELADAVAVMHLAFAPFTRPEPHAIRLQKLADAGAAAVVCIDPKDGRRVEYHNAGDWCVPEKAEVSLPCVTTSREHGALLRRSAGQRLKLEVVSRFYSAPTQNVTAHIAGARWPDQQIILGGHHDTVFGAAGGNDNASGAIAVLETARVLAGLKRELGVAPGCRLRFATFSGEEQRLAGAGEFARSHCGTGSNTRLVINLDELSTGHIKGVVLAFRHLRELVQAQLDDMGDGLKCYVMEQLDSSSDHFPFLRLGVDAAHLWRWRFHGRHADSNYHHEPADTMDKLNVRELKEYAGQLARLLLRLSHVAPQDWPENPQTVETVQARLEAERGTVIRVL